MFNMSAVNALRASHNLSGATEPAKKSGKAAKDDIASLLDLPGMDAQKLWMETAHSRPNVVKEVRAAN